MEKNEMDKNVPTRYNTMLFFSNIKNSPQFIMFVLINLKPIYFIYFLIIYFFSLLSLSLSLSCRVLCQCVARFLCLLWDSQICHTTMYNKRKNIQNHIKCIKTALFSFLFFLPFAHLQDVWNWRDLRIIRLFIADAFW